MAAPHGAVGELGVDPLGRRDVGRQHELLHHGVGLTRHLDHHHHRDNYHHYQHQYLHTWTSIGSAVLLSTLNLTI